MNGRGRKRFHVDVAKVRRVQQLLGAETETEAIERALDFLISHYKRNRQALLAHDELVASRIVIRDVYGVLTQPRNSKRTKKA